ncbi:MAG: hypothetical protein ACN6N0_13515 [Microvirgula sp.]
MTREFLNTQAAPDAAQQAAPAPAAPSVPVAAPAARPGDALIGAFPDWDLLPVTHFVRRVK